MNLEPVGTAEDLFALFARREYQAVGAPPAKGRLGRALLEPVFQGVGRLLAAGEGLLSPAASLRFQERLYAAIQGEGGAPEVSADDAGLRAAARLLAETERRAGKRPALACLLAHAPVDKRWLHLNPLMFRTALQGMARARGGPCRPRLINAVDAFALDMLAAHEEGAYAGFMSSLHMGFLRLTRARPFAGRLLTRGAEWDAVAWRLVRLLDEGGDLVMVLAGGVPVTARGYYALRESVGRLCRASPDAADPAAVLERLASAQASFRAFCKSGEVGPLKSAWRLLEAWVMDCALASSSRPALEAGRLDPAAEAALTAAAQALRLPAGVLGAERRTLAVELTRDTPFRERFFSLLARRLAYRGRPLVLLPLGWGSREAVRV
ncbi:MAG: hypothetical protein KGL53_15655, partial [Elusimicrobia bacterium]|nr:hypothetical protein [Elusimicrobiota bacterium]